MPCAARSGTAGGLWCASSASGTRCRRGAQPAGPCCCVRPQAPIVVCAHGRPKVRVAHERILRYPGGKVRRIRYPSVDEPDTDPWNVAASYEDDWDPDRWSGKTTWGVASRVQSSAPHRPQGVPDTAGELVRYLSSEQYKKALEDQWTQLRAMYQVLESSPWLQSRPMHLLALIMPGGETALTYTLRTRIKRPGVGAALDELLGGRKRPDGGPVLQIEELRDGIVAFEDESDAERYRALLQAEGSVQVLPVECDSHALFRQAQAVRAVIVWFGRGNEGVPPSPTMLAASLKRQRPIEESLE